MSSSGLLSTKKTEISEKSPAEGRKDDEGPGEPLLRGKAEQPTREGGCTVFVLCTEL